MARGGAAREERPKAANMRPLRALAPFLRPYRLTVLAALAALTVTAALSLTLPLAVRRVVDGFFAESLPQMDLYFTAAIGIAALLALGTALRFYLVTRLGERVVADIRRAIFDRVIGMSPAFFERVMTGEVLSRLTTDTTLVLSVIGSSVSVALRNVLTLVGGLVLLTITSPKLTALVLIGVPLVVFPILTLGRRVRLLSRENQDRIAESSAQASETLLAAQTVQANTNETASRARFGDLTERAFDAARRRIVTRSILTAIVIFLVFTSVVGVLWIGARDVRGGSMTPGELVQFVIYAVLVAGSVAALSEIWGELQRAAGATERMVELIEAADSIADPEDPLPVPAKVRGEIGFENVTFRYPARPETAAIHELTVAIRPGETVALVGPSGAGKSTIFQLLMRFFDPDEGRITLDGIDLRDVRRSDLRRQFALVPQEPVIFATTARENIRFGRPSASDAEVEAAARAAAAQEFIERLPQGYDTYVGERGVMLSGGQKQRLAIARAILRDASVLLLDEATSSLDAESERAVQLAVDRLAEGRTTLIIAHRLATVKRADRIIVFQDGRIVAEGSHGALVAEDGLYARLARLQFTDGAA
ncbi:MAG: ATP-binding cassette domain-containing protein [Rhodobacteraceae bacterium]|uniref:ABC transporter transmembrane domain-containing protein n=1 Tax=Amaricoccus sp. TaxID=1872485 RepID=UPI001DDFC218|nr:ABC transporter transmembrane domain-containing protein [Amaricoccus sp.]MCB1374295.1 ATP-binding cassette domain-containing protein [Paracoccaceae bacterium]HRW14919.1 ABC transporter transmembrane domain-containing protein [Amaricoccus sp.]